MSLIGITMHGMKTVLFSGSFAEQRSTIRLLYTGAYTNQYLSIDNSNKSVESALAQPCSLNQLHLPSICHTHAHAYDPTFSFFPPQS